MIKSPYGGSEFRSAIVSKLPPGEQLLSFGDCVTLDFDYDGLVEDVTWKFLALTNINLREGRWVFEETKQGFFNYSWALTPEIASMRAYAISDIVTTEHTEGQIDVLASNRISLLLGTELWPKASTWVDAETEVCCHLHLTLSNSTDELYVSPFVEFRELVANIEAAKSGALVAMNTAVAANALDQLVPLLNDGILTQEEFDRAKDGFLGATVEVRESSVGLLRQLHSLHKSGVLSESEFNLKKWDVLSKDG